MIFSIILILMSTPNLALSAGRSCTDLVNLDLQRLGMGTFEKAPRTVVPIGELWRKYMLLRDRASLKWEYEKYLTTGLWKSRCEKSFHCDDETKLCTDGPCPNNCSAAKANYNYVCSLKDPNKAKKYETLRKEYITYGESIKTSHGVPVFSGAMTRDPDRLDPYVMDEEDETRYAEQLILFKDIKNQNKYVAVFYDRNGKMMAILTQEPDGETGGETSVSDKQGTCTIIGRSGLFSERFCSNYPLSNFVDGKSTEFEKHLREHYMNDEPSFDNFVQMFRICDKYRAFFSSSQRGGSEKSGSK